MKKSKYIAMIVGKKASAYGFAFDYVLTLHEKDMDKLHKDMLDNKVWRCPVCMLYPKKCKAGIYQSLED